MSTPFFVSTEGYYMCRYLIKRLIQAVFVVLGISVMVFIIMHLNGDPTLLMLPPGTPEPEIEQWREKMGFNLPVYQQYLNFITGVLHGDFGESLKTGRPVLVMIMERFPATIELACSGILISIIIGIPLGILSAVKKDSYLDILARSLAVIGQAIPSFWLGLLLIVIFSITLHWLPTSGRGSLLQLIMPSITIGFFSMATVLRLTRSSLIEVLKADYIRTAKAKGLTHITIIFQHALRNSLLPLITAIGMEIGHLLGGSLLTETIFAWPGIGALAVEAIYTRDYPLVQAIVFITATVFVLINIGVDILYGIIDPRINYRKKE